MFSLGASPSEIDRTIKSVTLPDDLDRYLSESEAQFSDIIPGAEKKICWAGDPGQKRPYSIVYLHGFSATRQETAPLANTIAKQLNANLFYTRLTGHGRSSSALLEGSVNDWLNDAYEALEIAKAIGNKVIVIGNSTGATLATWLAVETVVEAVGVFVLLSPNYELKNRMAKMLTWPWRGHIAEFWIGENRCWEPHNELHARYWTNCYPTRSLLPMMDLLQMVKSLNLSEFKTPVLMACSPEDKIVKSAVAESIFAKLGADKKQFVNYHKSLDPNQHILAGDILSPETTDDLASIITDFVRAEV